MTVHETYIDMEETVSRVRKKDIILILTTAGSTTDVSIGVTEVH